jgi:hypothetical protein
MCAAKQPAPEATIARNAIGDRSTRAHASKVASETKTGRCPINTAAVDHLTYGLIDTRMTIVAALSAPSRPDTAAIRESSADLPQGRCEISPTIVNHITRRGVSIHGSGGAGRSRGVNVGGLSVIGDGVSDSFSGVDRRSSGLCMGGSSVLVFVGLTGGSSPRRRVGRPPRKAGVSLPLRR